MKTHNNISHGSITIENINYDDQAPFSPEPVNYKVAGLLGFNNDSTSHRRLKSAAKGGFSNSLNNGENSRTHNFSVLNSALDSNENVSRMFDQMSSTKKIHANDIDIE